MADIDATVDSERLLRAVLTADLGLWELDVASGSFFCSGLARAHHGLHPTASLGYDDFLATFPVPDRDRVHAALGRAREGDSVSLRCRAPGRDGTLQSVELRAVARHDEAGRVTVVTGVSRLLHDVQRVEERLQLLDAVGEATRIASKAEDVMAITCRLLGEYLSATRVAYADVDADNDGFHIRHDWTLADAGSTVGEYSLTLFGSRAVADLARGRPLTVRDVDGELAVDDGAAMFNAIGIKAIVCCSLVREDRLLALMAVHQATPRDWSEDDVRVVQAVVERCWAHIERIRAAEQLLAQDRLKDEFIATLAHELRTPLASIRLGLPLLERAAATSQERERVTQIMRRQVGHLVRLVDDLLDIARIRRGQLTLQQARMPLQDAIRDGLEASRPYVDAAAHHLQLELPPSPIYVDGDLTRLAQVVANLVNNAAKYTPHGGRLKVALVASDKVAELRVHDDGMGMDAELLPKVFTLFEQGRGTLHRSQGGLGLGLALVRKLVEMHHGTVTASSEGVGQGSTFVVTLPLLEPVQAAYSAEHPTPASAQPLRILVVEDNEDAGEILMTALALKGHDVELARDGASGLERAAAFAPAVILLDLGLPDQSGLQVAKALRANPLTREIRLIALTGWGGAQDRELTREAGFDVHLTKPADLHVLDSILAELCSTAGAPPRRSPT